MVEGMLRLCTLPYQSANSYFDAANGGFAGTFLNAAIVCAVCAAIYSLPGSKPDGVSVLAYFLTAGFCFWGITVLNIWFCFAGVLIGCLIRKVKFYTQGNVFLFSTGIAPLMTDLLIRYPGAESRGVTLFGAVLTLLVCTVIGLILPAGLAHSPKVHKGYDLYSAAVPVGLTAFFLRAVLYRVLGGTLPDGVGVGAGDGNWAVCNIFCIAVFVLALVLGLGLGGSFSEIVAMDYVHNTMLLGHDGPFHISISNGRPMLRGMGVYHGKKGTGVSVEAKVRPGPVTMLGLTQLANGRLRFIASEGEAKQLPILTIGNTQTHIDFGMELDAYMDEWFRCAPTHHCAMSVGHNAALFEKVAELLGAEFVHVGK